MVELKMRIDYSDMDMFGHVNNVTYFKYMQSSRVNYWEKSGMMKAYLQNKIGPILASATCNFIKPLFYPGEVRVVATMRFIKNTSFGLLHKVYNDKDELVAEAEDVMVMYDFNKNDKVVFPEEFRKACARLEDRETLNT
jgi:acyl-CoA thioester hydrolase